MPRAKECNLADLFRHARAGALDECRGCPRNPCRRGAIQKVGLDCIFALGCGFHQRMEPGAVRILFLLQDPSSSPQWPKAVGCEDGHVCPWCHTDSSGRNIERLFTEHLSRVLKMDRQGRWPVVFSNGVLHGPLVKREPEDEELEHCALVNRRLVEILRPTLVVAMGVQARDHVMPPIFGDAARTNAFLEGARPVALEGKRHIFWTGHPSGNGFPERAEEMARSFKAIRRHLMAHP